MRHGLTLGELALLVNKELEIGASVEVIRMQGWHRRMLFSDTGRHWVLPSPNMPQFETALVYPGQVLLEGTNISEGRGTTLPFELFGAPFIEPHALVEQLDSFQLGGVCFRPVRFVPTFDKWKGQSCGGAAIHITDPREFHSFRATIALLASVKQLWPDQFRWLPPPYEYEHEKMPIDILYGSPRLRETLDGNAVLSVADIDDLVRVDVDNWHARTAPFRLYD
jgi:uncharacterized protein YbbC (DUF1343 family)